MGKKGRKTGSKTRTVPNEELLRRIEENNCRKKEEIKKGGKERNPRSREEVGLFALLRRIESQRERGEGRCGCGCGHMMMSVQKNVTKRAQKAKNFSLLADKKCKGERNQSYKK